MTVYRLNAGLWRNLDSAPGFGPGGCGFKSFGWILPIVKLPPGPYVFSGHMASTVVELSFVLVFVFSFAAFFERKLSASLGGKKATLMVVCVGMLPIAAIYLFTALTTPMPYILSVYNGAFFWLAALSGLFFAMGFVLFLKGLETEQVTNAESIMPIQYVLIALFGVTFLGEAITPLQFFAGAVILFGAFMVSTRKEHPLKFNWALAPVFFAQISWAVYWMILSFTITRFGVASEPLAVSRLFGAMFVFSFYSPVLLQAVRRKTALERRFRIGPIAALGLAAALLDGTGNYIFSVISLLNGVAVGSLILLISIPTVAVLAHIFYKERLSKVQLAGLALAFIGGVLSAVV